MTRTMTVATCLFALACGNPLDTTMPDAGGAPDISHPPDLAPVATNDLAPAPDLEIAAPVVPGALALPDGGGQVLLETHAQGVQIYDCTSFDGGVSDAGAPQSTYSWVFKAPQATLYDDHMKVVGMHYAGPTWELGDSSKLVAMVLAKSTPDPNSIPWLLLRAISHAGNGLLAKVLFVQRVHTSAGIAPAKGCDGSSVGAEQQVPYQADYFFFGNP